MFGPTVDADYLTSEISPLPNDEAAWIVDFGTGTVVPVSWDGDAQLRAVRGVR